MFNISELIDEKTSLPLVMGIVNVTPDSFSDGGQFVARTQAEQHIAKMVADGVDILDIGGESTRPGAKTVSLQQELDRVLPMIEWAAQRFATPISVDTYKTEVMSEAIRCGAKMINDVNALQAEGALAVAAESGVSVCLMHRQGDAATMQNAPGYDDVVTEVSKFLMSRARLCEQSGILPGQIVVDPGFGFGKDLAHNVTLFERLDVLVDQAYPVLVGVSRKRMIGEILKDAPVSERMVGSVAAAVLASLKGAKILRVHDVKETMDALEITMRLM